MLNCPPRAHIWQDEAVVAALLARAEAAAPGAVQLEAWPSDVLPHLRRRAGLSSWRVAEHVDSALCPADGADDESDDDDDDDDDDDEVRLRWHASHEAAVAAGMPYAVASLWPPSPTAAKGMHLERCSRMLPHDQDTGGFFIALLRKKAPLPHESLADGAPSGGTVLPPTGPASCRQLPPLPPEQAMVPLAPADAEALGERHGVKAAKKRLLRRRDAVGRLDERALRVAPLALAAFPPEAVCVVDAGVGLPGGDDGVGGGNLASVGGRSMVDGWQ